MKITNLKFLWKPIVVLAGVAVLLVVGGALMRGCGCGDQPQLSDSKGIPAGWQTVTSRVKTPLLGKNEASEKTKGFPAGTKVVVLRPPKGELAEVAILPDGEIAVPTGTEATIYEKRSAIINPEIRPWLGGGATVYPEIRPTAAVGIDILNIWRVHTGPGISVDSEAFSGVWTASVGAWRNVDVRAGGGYGTSGPTGFVGISIGIE